MTGCSAQSHSCSMSGHFGAGVGEGTGLKIVTKLLRSSFVPAGQGIGEGNVF